MTKYEKIKNMSVEEIVRMLECDSCNFCVYCEGMCECPQDSTCTEGIRQYLNNEAEE